MREISELLINKDASIKEAMKAIDTAGIKMILIADDLGKLCGIATDGDIRRGILNGLDIQERVSKVMNSNPIFANLGTPKEEILHLLKSKNIIGLPLIDKQGVPKEFVLLSGGTDTRYFSKDKNLARHLDRVLVIGGAGYIGSVLVRKLLSKGYKVNILDKFIYGRDSVKEIESNRNLKVLKGDTRHIEDIIDAITDADAVVHLAELVGDPACALNPSLTQGLNYLATRTIAEVCKHFQINRLVYGSSCSVYGASNEGKLLSEDSPLNPVSLYAKMKIASENALKEMQDENFHPTILRFATVFGFSYRPRFDLVVNLLTARAVKENKITLFGGEQWRPNVHVEDVADTVISVLGAPIEVVGSQIFNVGSEKNNYTINQIAELVKKVVPSAEVIIDDRKVDKRDYKVDFSKLRKTLNVKMRKSVLDGIEEVKKALEENREIDYRDSRYSNIKFLKNNLIAAFS